jgi:hypothetical protein
LIGFAKEVIGLLEMPVAEKATMRREGRRMRAFQNQVPVTVNKAALFLGIASPEQENDILPFLVECGDGRVGEFFPAFVLV